MTLEELITREEIRQLRIDYSTYFDSQNEQALRYRLAPDIHFQYGAQEFKGIEAVIALFRDTWHYLKNPFEVLHMTSNHSIELTGSETATGHCILIDIINQQEEGVPHATRGGHDIPFHLIGRYEDDYIRKDGRWIFSSIRLSPLWPEWNP